MNEKEAARIEAAVKNALSTETVRSAKTVTLTAANKLIAEVLKEAARIGVNAVAAVSDAFANPVSVQCSDNSFPASYDIALNKSYTSAAMKMSTAVLKDLAQPGGSLYGIQNTNGNKIVIFGGGVPLGLNGATVGALGVSGGTESEDTYLAEFGLSVWEELQ